MKAFWSFKCYIRFKLEDRVVHDMDQTFSQHVLQVQRTGARPLLSFESCHHRCTGVISLHDPPPSPSRFLSGPDNEAIRIHSGCYDTLANTTWNVFPLLGRWVGKIKQLQEGKTKTVWCWTAVFQVFVAHTITGFLCFDDQWQPPYWVGGFFWI